jgi:alpha-mannosidase
MWKAVPIAMRPVRPDGFHDLARRPTDARTLIGGNQNILICNDSHSIACYDTLSIIVRGKTMIKIAGVASWTIMAMLCECLLGSARAQPVEIFSIGTRDGLFAEFERRPEAGRVVLYKVGESSPERDWPAYQPGSFDPIVTRSTMQQDWVTARSGPSPQPFQVQFNLPALPRGSFILHLDAIFRYRRPAPPRYTLLINRTFASAYRLNPHPAPELWWKNGGEAAGDIQYFGYESLEVELPASAFIAGTNTLSIQCLDGFGIYYDDLSLSNDPLKRPLSVTEASIEATPLYKRHTSGLVELAKVRLRTTKPLGDVKLKIEIGSAVINTDVLQHESGDAETTIEVPATDKPVVAKLYIAGNKEPLYRGIFTPRRRWQVYALPMEQADFGYNDLPARTLEWENRFLDKALDIQQKYDSYSFTLDAAANLDSYLSTRKDEKSKQLLGHLQSGKWGINALYTNFFTGLSTPEELYRMLDFSLNAGHKYRFAVDSASQTDVPSVTWALPQILADAGVKYFTNGSDPIRGAFNPIGHLNFRSPFYWETPTGSKVLVWSGISYVAVNDMTWGGWDPNSARIRTYATSLFGLTRSLPVFLSQYDRDDYPFDAVLLFGLHNDEIPIRHWGDADTIEMWNREYAYPRIIPATQRQFFRHVADNFGSKIKTYHGDGGSYWEDEAGADARITSMVRAAQTQLVAAETFESIAAWLQPHLKFDRQPFDAAWKNILLADSYVWSDANSFRRPESYRTRGGEAAHRAWAEAAFQQASDLRLVAMDKISELIDTDQQGAVVFNPESWRRSDFFDFELEPDEELIDPATGQTIPCGSMKRQNGYQDVRCWASDVPATGYKFFAIRKGRVPEGEPLSFDPSRPVIENTFYKVELSSRTGAIAHLIDKSTGNDLVGSGDYQLNDYIYVSGGDPGEFIPGSVNDNRLLAADITLPLPKLTINRGILQTAPTALRFPWGTVITLHSRALNTPSVDCTITLLDLQKQVNIRDTIEKTTTLQKEGVYFAFPFGLKRPHVKYQSATAWVDPETEMLPGANRQWFAIQGGVWESGVGTDLGWVTVDAPLITLEGINSGLWPDSIRVGNGGVFSYVMNNYWYTDAPAAQGGRFTFGYALTSGTDVSQAKTMMLASEQRSPLVAIRHYQMGWQPALSDKGSGFLDATPPGVTILTIRPLKSADAYVVRVQNSTAEAINAHLRFPAVVLHEAYLGSVMGERAAPINWTPHSVTLPMGRNEIKTLVVRIEAGN